MESWTNKLAKKIKGFEGSSVQNGSTPQETGIFFTDIMAIREFAKA